MSIVSLWLIHVPAVAVNRHDTTDERQPEKHCEKSAQARPYFCGAAASSLRTLHGQ